MISLMKLFGMENIESIAEIRVAINCENIQEEADKSTIQVFKEEIACAVKNGLERLSAGQSRNCNLC